MQTINAADLTTGDRLVPSGQKVVSRKARVIGGKPFVLLTVRDRRGVLPLTFRANERVTVRRGE